MCGISGLINRGDRPALDRMMTLVSHRGPDDDGTWVSQSADGGFVGLGSRRLAILDLSSAGHMPMTTSDGRFTIVYNGEIYNSPSLRREIESRGRRLRSSSDTEVVLNLFAEHGPASVESLVGMFSFAVWDSVRCRLFLARDHFGIKPLYYHQTANGGLAFASELKSLLALDDLSRRMNHAALDQYLSFLWVPEPSTILDGIHKIPAGHRAVFDGGKLEVERYWDLSFPAAGEEPNGVACDLLAEELRERLDSVVKSQMLSDVPVGAFLSAGLDSSSIVACMARHSSRPVRTFTISFPQKYLRGQLTMDDTDVARRTAAHFGCEHTDIRVEPDVVSLLPRLVWHMDEPVADPAIITAYLVNREARKDVTVLLSGVGGDEIFAGYRKYQGHYLAQQYQRVPSILRHRLIEPGLERLPPLRGTFLEGYVRLAKKMARSGSLPPRDRFITDSIYLSSAEKRALYSDELLSRTTTLDPRSTHQSHFDRVSDSDFLHQMLYLDTKSFLVSLNLNYNDKMSMASSVEVRVPFLDWRLAEWAAKCIPPRLKLQNGTTKHVLREAMRPWLPAEVLRQKKAGFGAPVGYWLANDLRSMVDDLLCPEVVRRRGLFNPAEVQRMVADHRSGRRDRAYQIWQLLTLELWIRELMN